MQAETSMRNELQRRYHSAMQEDKPDTTIGDGAPCDGVSGEPLLILVADDDPVAIAPAIALINKCGHRVVHVRNGKDAVAAYVAERPDMVLMDVMMPEMDGIEATRAIRQMVGERWVPLLMLTSMDSKQNMLDGLEAGADDYLAKPIDIDILYARMSGFQRIAMLQRQMHSIVDNAFEGIITIDGHGIVGTFNPAAETIFGYAAVEVVGKNISMLMPSPDREMHDGYIERYLKEGAPRIIGKGRKVTGLRKNGEQFPMQLFVTIVRQPSGVQFIGMVRDITREEEERQKVEYLAHYDALTGLPNRKTFQDALEAACACARGGVQPCALLFIDLDGFKTINDKYGHDVGDEALVTVSRRMRHSLAHEDMIARLGGDEFVVVLQNVADTETAGAVATRLIDVVGQPMELKGNACQMGASIGIALTPAHALGPDDLLTLADNAMYEAKRFGKNRFVVAPFSR